jgi:competence protein ComEC
VTVAVVILAGRAIDHRGSALNALAIAALFGAALTPVVVLNPGFVLSFGATLGILLGVPRMEPCIRRVFGSRAVRRLLMPFAVLCLATICAEIGLAPAAATLFARVTFAGLLLNLVAVPLMTIVQISGLIVTAAAAWWDGGARLAGGAAHLAAAGLLRSAHLVDAAPWLCVEVSPPAWWLTVAYYVAALAVLTPRARRSGAMCLTVAAGVLLAAPRATSRDAVSLAPVPLRVVVLDVGQGDASVLLLPGGKALLVDAGGVATFSSVTETEQTASGFDVGARVVVPALRALGVGSIEGLVLTHGDPDHILGATAVLRHFGTHELWEGVPVPPHPGLKALTAMAAAAVIPWRMVQAGDAERYGDVEVRMLHPPLPEWERQRVRNDDSVVLELRLGDVSIVLPGDIGREGERAILPRLERGRLVVLKAPHHGSATSSTPELLDALQPAAVIFSCGRDNRFGHPHPAVVARYESIGARVFSTAHDGAVFVETDGRAVTVRGWMGRREEFGRQ